MGKNTHRFKICALCMFFESHLLVWLCNNSDSLFQKLYFTLFSCLLKPPVFKLPLLFPSYIPSFFLNLQSLFQLLSTLASVNWVVDRWEDTSSHRKLGRPLGLKFSSSFSLDRETDEVCVTLLWISAYAVMKLENPQQQILLDLLNFPTVAF